MKGDFYGSGAGGNTAGEGEVGLCDVAVFEEGVECAVGAGGAGEENDTRGAAVDTVHHPEVLPALRFELFSERAPVGFITGRNHYDSRGFIDGDEVLVFVENRDHTETIAWGEDLGVGLCMKAYICMILER